ncbi:NAD(P)-dependent oxidoreductase [Sphingobium sp. Sx8-8]|uniref:NAD-dependent epimerase/dehydratase family protein n=1 Tax=Sphingobium sp. Sx8-8 TaxID=2933617 RepID=UPI001F55B069|nr:NAD(P)-dependent oxidoreductase [Sphingobium sp. Sx8-8]
MLNGKRILVTGVTGVGPFPIAKKLAKDNEVWGAARFNDPAIRAEAEAAGIRTVPVDLASGDLSALPGNFDYVLHFAWWRGPIDRLNEAISINVEGAGFVLEHCRKAKAALIVSGMGVYGARTDPWHLYHEDDPIGRGATAYAETSPTCKVGLEAVARYCARAFDLPVTIARLNTVFGVHDAYHGSMIKRALKGEGMTAPCDPNPHSPIHNDDMADQIEALLDAAAVPALITNWCGDELITTQDAAAQIEKLTGRPLPVTVQSFPGAPTGTAADPTRRRSITGPCKVKFAPALERLVQDIMDAPALAR